ncbi:MAG: NAD(P)H-dependent oxidoreductase [Ruminococcaceae bacterium]|nr:NAD(P)H-dependent oxidoreductase [Oscillospiraceae bacterium]
MLTVINLNPAGEPRLSAILEQALGDRPHRTLPALTAPLRDCRLLFAVSLGADGINHALYDLLSYLRSHPGCLQGCVGGVLIDGAGDLYTKTAGRELVLAASLAGCTFIGRPLVEATGDLRNFAVQAKNAVCSLDEAYALAAADLVRRTLSFAPVKSKCPKLLVLHASSHRTSNTMALWSRVRAGLAEKCDIKEVGLRNGTLEDCAGCPYTMCLHFGEQGECFYGGVMVQEVYPAIREADAVILLCPNYNDALSANLTAAINRLTALYRTTPFTDKAVFAMVVSGYSGGDIVASQVISALNMNKGFWLPANFCMLETANDAGTAIHLPGIESRLEKFTKNILCQLID